MDTDAIPIELRADGQLEVQVRAWVESTLGWQVVEPDTGVPPVCALVAPGGAHPPSAPPVLLVPPGQDAAAVARAAVELGARAVLRWPDDRGDLPATVARIAASRDEGRSSAGEIAIAGASGGVGTSTVALAVAGLAAWSGAPTLVVARTPLPVVPRRVFAPDDLAGAGTWDAATRLPGVPGLRLAATDRDAAEAPVDPGGARLIVRDLGTRLDDADVLVARCDRPGLVAAEATAAAVVVLVGEGPAPPRAVAAALGDRRVVRVPWSVRVARAGWSGRVPTSLPGAWLRRLRPVLSSRPQG